MPHLKKHVFKDFFVEIDSKMETLVKSLFESNSLGMKQMRERFGITFCCTVRKNFPKYISSFKFVLALQAQMMQENMHSTF